jgi:hypothetical protein
VGGELNALHPFRELHGSGDGGGGNGRLKGNLLLALAHVGGTEIDSLPASTGRVDL